MDRAPRVPSGRNRGFTVVELTISLAVTVIVLLAVLQLFDFSSKISRVQSNVADMQQTQRVAQYELTKIIRMAGRGGLPAKDLPNGFAVAVADNVIAGTLIGGAGTEPVVTGTDVLTVRGSFTNEPWVIQRGATPIAFTYNSATGLGTVQVKNLVFGKLQPLDALIDAVNNNRPEALLLVGAKSTAVYMTVEINPATTVPNPVPAGTTSFTLGFRYSGGTNTAAYQRFSSTAPAAPSIDFTEAGAEISSIALLEEFRYYLREEREIPGDATSELIRHLTRAQTYPNTNNVYKADPLNWTLDIADNVLDLQVALGVNTLNGGCQIQSGGDTACGMFEAANGVNDDWLLNELPASPGPGTVTDSDLRYVRIDTLVRTDKRDNTYQAPPIARIENRDYTGLAPNTSTSDRMYRRRVLQTIVDLRSL